MKLSSFAGTCVALIVAAPWTLAAQQVLSAPTPPDSQFRHASLGVRTDIPLLDAPYNLTNGGRGPSMAQSLAVGEGFYELAHPAIQRAWGTHTKLADLSLVLFDTFGSLLPAGDGWVHEEFHRSVLGSRGVNSFDDIYKLNLLADAVNVSHVHDADLIRMKADHPTDYVRAEAAGIEGENQLIEQLEKNRFYHDSRSNNVPFYWLSKINSAAYVGSGVWSETDSLTDATNLSEGANVAKRDWVGHDFTAWVHDLFHPTEAFDARGVHPSGVGLNRYIRAKDLTQEEHDFLAREGYLQLLNFADPNLLGFGGVTVRDPWRGADLRVNASAGHYLTSFGHTIDVNVFLKEEATNLFVVLHRYTNGARSLPGMEVQLLDAPVTVAGMAFDVSPRVALWLQPRDQGFHTTSAQSGGLVSVRVRPVTSARIGTFVELEGKTAGWVAGNVHLERNVSVRIGASVRVN
ncbi:MAG: hypothetical protein ABJF01_23500 [bacterium]